MQKITPFLWFDGNAEEAVRFYLSVFPEANLNKVVRQAPDGPAFTLSFQLFGQEFVALNGGPMFRFTEAVSFVVNCHNQDEVNYYWEKLGAGGQYSRCGWLKDRFGLSWQVVPSALPCFLTDADPARSGRVMQALLQMDKIDLPTLEAAFIGQEAES